MDIYIFDMIDSFNEIVTSLKFTIKDKSGYSSAVLNTEGGRYHLLYKRDQDKVFCDFHFDKSIHLLFFGVDYKTKPLQYFDLSIKPLLQGKKIGFNLNTVDWFTRRNKAIITGFKIK